MKSAQELYDEGRPNVGHAFTHEPHDGNFHQLAGRVPLGVIRDGAVVRDYEWKPLTAGLRVAIGKVKARFSGRADQLMPAILAESLASFGGEKATIGELCRLPHQNITFLMLDRLTEYAGGRLPVQAGAACQHCGAPIRDVYRDEVDARWFEWTADTIPGAVAWLDHPFDYNGSVDALFVGPVAYADLYRGLTAAEAQQEELLAARQATLSIRGYFADGQFKASPIAPKVAEMKMHGADVDPVSTAVSMSSGMVLPYGLVEHKEEQGGCGKEAVVPFDWISGQ